MKKKFLALVMTLSMVLSLVPMTALAAEEQPPAEPKQETQADVQVGQKEEPTASVAEKESTQDEQKNEAQETSASEFTVDGLTYKVTENKNSVNVIRWDDSNKKVIIPAEVSDSTNNTYSVEGISASSGFQNSDLESIEIQAPIEALEDSTFLKCQSLTTVKLPSSIKKIGSNAFQGCGNITKLEGIDWSKVEVIGKQAFESAFLGTADPIVFNEESFKSIQELGASAFKNAKNLTGKIVIPEGIETINNDVFNGTEIEQLVLPNSLQKIGDRAFAFCRQLEKIQIGENKSSQLNYIGLAAFGSDVSVESFAIETSKEYVEAHILAFRNCAMQPTYTIMPPEGSNIEGNDETTLQDAVNQAKDGDIITIKKGILLDGPVIVDGKNVTITDDGENHTIMTEENFSQPMFEVKNGASLTLEGNIEYNCYRMSGHFAKVQGSLTLNSGSISGTREKNPNKNIGAVDVDGGHFIMNGGEISNTRYVVRNGEQPNGTVHIHNGGEFTMNDGTICKTHSGGLHCGTVYVDQIGTFTMNDGKICDSDATGKYTASVLLDGLKAEMLMKGGEISGNTASLENSTPGVAVSNGASFEMEDGTIANNNGWRGGGVLVGTTTDTPYSGEETAARFTMNGGEISNNTVTQKLENSGGGGVLVQNNAEFIMNNGIITGNTAKGKGMGGGVATSNQEMDGGGRFTMNGGTISNNSAACGGGVYSYSQNTVTLRGGYILSNRAGNNGGGVYVSTAPYNITLENALVTGNTASVMGGGIWSCPTGTVVLGSDSAVYDNTATKAGDDIAFLNKESGYYSTFGSTILGNGTVTWYKDNSVIGNSGQFGSHTNWRYDSENPGDPVEGASQSMGNHSLKAVISEENKKLAENATTHLFIQGNTATRGGGVGTNGEVIFSGATTSVEPMSVAVNKVWKNDNGNHPATVTVNLIRTTKDGTDRKETIDSVTLSEANNWAHTFSNLSVDYTYTVTENAVTRYETEITKNKSEKTNVVSYTITNTYKHTGGGNSGGGPITIPDDVPTGLDLKNHYGYIIGYPVDYYTGKPTTDQTKKPVRPEGKITRAEVATIYFRMLTDENRAANWNQVSGFSDVKSSAWYNNAISTLTKAGILKGYEDGTFQPNGYITRAEFATIAIRFFSGVYEGEDLFPDIKGHWAEDYINNAANKGLVKGYEDGTFGPDRYITRAEAVTLVNRTLNRHPHNDGLHQDMLRWPDNMDTSKWYYADMQEATNSHEPDKNKSTADKEYWGKMLPIRDWEALEKEWSNANSAPGEGEVV